MTTKVEMEAKVAKHVVNMDRHNAFINNESGDLVAIDGGVQVKPLKQLEEEAQIEIDEAAALAAAAEASAAAALAVSGAHVVDFAGGAAEGQAIHGSNLAVPAARYAATVDEDGYLDIEMIAGAFDRVAWRSRNEANKIGRLMTLTVAYPAANFSTNFATGFCFTDKMTTGVNANAGASAFYLYERANGAVQFLNDAEAAVADYVLTLVSGVASIFAAGDVGTFTYERLVDGNARFTMQKGATAPCIYTISPAPPQAMACPMMRFPGGSGVAGNGANPHGKIRAISWADFQPSYVTQNTYLSPIVELPIAQPVRHSIVEATVDDPEAFRQRAVPPGMPSPPVLPLVVHGYGDITYNRSLLAAYLEQFPDIRTGSIAFVHPTLGNDGTAVVGDRTKPFLLATTAYNSAALIVALEDGQHKPFDCRSEHAAAGRAKLFIAINSGRASWRTPGDDLNGIVATDTGDGIYEFALVAAANAAPIIHRLVRHDVLNRHSRPTELVYYASDAALRAVGTGWWVDVAGKKLRVGLGGLNVNTFKAVLEAFWVDAAGQSRCFANNAICFSYGIDFAGVTAWAFNDAPGGQASEFWRERFESTYSLDYSIYASAGGRVRQMDGVVYSPLKDGWNINYADGVGNYAGYSILSLESGAVDTYGGNGGGSGSNKQAGSSHSGEAAEMGCVALDNNGQQWADTTLAAVPNVSWYVGNYARLSRHEALSAGISDVGFLGQGKNAVGADNRMMYMDTNRSDSTVPMMLQARAAAKLFNNSFAVGDVDLQTSSVAPTVYAPEAP